MEIKKHYKLYKDGKQWCCMALAAVAVSAGLIFGNPNVKADTTVTADPQTEQVVTPATDSTSQSTDLAAQEKAAQVKDNGNYGWLDSANVVNNGNLQVSGWQATNQAAGKDNRYVIAYDSTTNTELGRTKIEGNTARPDVAKAYPNVVNAKDAGYQATMNNLDWNKVKSVDDHLQIVSRYSDAANGEGDNVDSWSQPINLDKSNNAYLDNFSIVNNQLQVTGWNATNKALGKNNHYIILFDRTAGHELARQEATVVVRPDVAKVYPQVINAQNSGFNVSFSLANVDLSHELQIISRYSDAKDGEGNNINYWFAPKKFISNTSNQGSLDSFNLSNGELTVAGWHATDYSQVESNHYLILFDKSNNTQVASMKVTNVARPDVAKAYPAVQSAGQAGFNASFGKVNLTPDHTYQIVSRYSTLAEGNGDNGQSRFTDFWFAPVTLNQQAYSIDNFSATKDGFNVTGWVASDQAINKQNPYLILLNNGKEIARTKLSLTDRPDVARVYPSLYNSQKSGFNVNLKVDPAAANGTLKLLLRFAGSTDGKTDFSDQTSPDYPTNIGNFDNIHVTATKISLSGWHASTQATDKPYEYLIVLDNTGKELYRQQITDKNISRPDVQNAYRYVEGANKSGFQVTMDIPNNMQGKLVRFIHRITDDAQENGNYIDFYSKPILVNLQYNLNGNSINRYILNNKINHANIQVNHVINVADANSGVLTDTYSGTEDGKPNMVVVHETANPNDSIQGEINFEKTHYNDAFVHAFVDGNQIIEIAPTDQEAWGAAYPANGRAVQFEQVEVYGANNFARELVNAAYYTAYKMNEYGMVPELAQANGTGTLWSHHNVSQYLGGTDHTDPDNYWSNRASNYFGTTYTMRDFFELVKYEYSHL